MKTHPWSEIEKKIGSERLARIKATVDAEIERITNPASYPTISLPSGQAVVYTEHRKELALQGTDATLSLEDAIALGETAQQLLASNPSTKET